MPVAPDVAVGAGRVELLDALCSIVSTRTRRDWPWQSVFPASRTYADPVSWRTRHHHLHETVAQRAVRGHGRRRAIAPGGGQLSSPSGRLEQRDADRKPCAGDETGGAHLLRAKQARHRQACFALSAGARGAPSCIILAVGDPFPYLDEGKDFEKLCLELLRRDWSCQTLDLYGRPGQGQHGIDIIDTSGTRPLRAIQCKYVAPHRVLRATELHAEVAKAKAFRPKLGEYWILTTSKDDTGLRDALLKINQEHEKKKLFHVRLQGQYDLERMIERHPVVLKQFLKSTGNAASRLLSDSVKGRTQGDSRRWERLAFAGSISVLAFHSEVLHLSLHDLPSGCPCLVYRHRVLRRLFATVYHVHWARKTRTGPLPACQ